MRRRKLKEDFKQGKWKPDSGRVYFKLFYLGAREGVSV
jgi:hypothetical protein